jgi:uncharacterized membrane protein
MDHYGFRPRIAIGGVPIHAMLVPFPIACFTGALFTDLAYAGSAQVQWTNFSQWLLAFGTVFAGLAAVFGLLDYFLNPRRARPAIGVWHMVLNLLLFGIALVNNLVHARDGWTGVVPTGLTLSLVTVAVMIVSGFLGHRMAYVHVSRDPARDPARDTVHDPVRDERLTVEDRP